LRSGVKVIFRQSGGFVGLDRGSEIETKSLPPTLRQTAESLITREIPISPANPASRDQTAYQLRIEGDGNHRELRFDDETMPDELSGLVAHLRDAAGPLPPQPAK
jgi:hypothetical protein